MQDELQMWEWESELDVGQPHLQGQQGKEEKLQSQGENTNTDCAS